MPWLAILFGNTWQYYAEQVVGNIPGNSYLMLRKMYGNVNQVVEQIHDNVGHIIGEILGNAMLGICLRKNPAYGRH